MGYQNTTQCGVWLVFGKAYHRPRRLCVHRHGLNRSGGATCVG